MTTSRTEASGVMSNPDFVKFWAGQSVSLLGSQFSLLAIPFVAAITLRATPAQVGLLSALQFVPGLVFGPVAGVWLDRKPRRPMLTASQLVSAAALLTIPLAAFAGVLTIGQLWVVALVTGTATTFYAVAQSAFLPSLVGRGHLVEANEKYLTSATAASLLGPGLAGAAVQALGGPIATAIDAVSFLVGAGTSAWLKAVETHTGQAGARRDVVLETVEGAVAVWRQPLVRSILISMTTANGALRVFAAVSVLLFIGQLGVTPLQMGIVGAALSLSSLVGAQVSRRLLGRLGVGRVMVGACLLLWAGSLLNTAAAYVRGPEVFAGLILAGIVTGFGLMSYNIPQQAIRQVVIHDRLLARTGAALLFLVRGGQVAGALLGGLVGETLGLRAAVVLASVVYLGCFLAAALSPLRTLRELPVPPVAVP